MYPSLEPAPRSVARVDVPVLSVVVPFYDEEGVAREVVAELVRALGGLDGAAEVVLVDDGSDDGTAGELELAARDHAGDRRVGVRILRLPANRGQGFALHAGIAACRAPVIATMDGDGQNVPDDLLRMLPLLSGADMIVGVRADRRDSVLRRLVSRAANAIRGRLLRDARSDAGCAVKVFRREVAAAFFPLKMLNPFMPALASAAGHTLAEIPVRHRARTAGRSKYGLGALSVRPVADFITVWRRIHYS